MLFVLESMSLKDPRILLSVRRTLGANGTANRPPAVLVKTGVTVSFEPVHPVLVTVDP